jgi:hypothetical protein
MKLARGEIRALTYWPIGLGLGLVLFSNLIFTTAVEQGRSVGGLICLFWLIYAVPIVVANNKIKAKRQALQVLGTKELLQYLKRLEDELRPPHLWASNWGEDAYEKLHTLYQVRSEIITRPLTESQYHKLLDLRANSEHYEDLRSFRIWLNSQN